MKEKQATDLRVETVRAFSELRNNIRRYIQDRIKEQQINITYEMLEVMFHLWRRDGIKQQELSDITFRDKSSTTYLIDNLVKRKLVARADDENDRRNKLIKLTPGGMKLKERLSPLMTEMYHVLGTGISDAAMTNSIRVLKKMNKNIIKSI